MRKGEVYLNQPIYLGQVILDISKILMYEFWYDYLKPKYGKNIKLCYMDTDSFVIRIKTDNFYKDISNVLINGLIQAIIIKMLIDHCKKV